MNNKPKRGFSINETPVFFTKLFDKGFEPKDIKDITENNPENILFIDTPPTPGVIKAIKQVKQAAPDAVLTVRDHHDVDGEPANEREQQIRTSVEEVRSLVQNTLISNRAKHPACSQLVGKGEFAGPKNVIVADFDLDGLTGAMKAAGADYSQLDQDAAMLDGPRNLQNAENGLSELAVLLTKGMATVPPYNPKNPEDSERAKLAIYKDFVNATQGDNEACKRLNDRVEIYEQCVAEAEKIASQAQEVAPGVYLADTVDAGQYDLGVLSRLLESNKGCKITVVRKSTGPIAAAHGGVQYSLAVKKPNQCSINLQDLLPENFESSPQAGLISNTTFLLHCSEKVWKETVLPALHKS